MAERTLSPTNPWLVKLASPPTATHRIVAFPNAGGTASAYRSWVPHLPSGCELLVLQLPGRQKRARETPLREMDTALEQMLPAIAGLHPCRTTFIGDCVGALFAYEAIRAAAAREQLLPERLVVACSYAPHLRPPCRALMHTLSEDDLIAELAAHSLVPAWLLQDSETLKAFLPLLRCDYEMVETYQHKPGAPIDVPITAFVASDDTVVRRDDVSPWQGHTSKAFELIEIEGGHNAPHAGGFGVRRLRLILRDPTHRRKSSAGVNGACRFRIHRRRPDGTRPRTPAMRATRASISP
jgi:surfactin synthase thioesterase subunit